MSKNKKWYQLVDNGTVADLYIFGDITSFGRWWDSDPDRSAYNIVQELQSVSADNIMVHINSYGGDVSEGLAIYNTLKNTGKNVTTVCDGFACSAASVVFMAGTERVMNRSSLLMIHNAWTYAAGDSNALRKEADDLETITQASVAAYKDRSSLSEDEIKEMMDAETWITAEKACEYGFATSIMEDDTEGMQQSAMPLLRKLLTEQKEDGSIICMIEDMNEKIEKISEKVSQIEIPKEMKPSSNWEGFF